MLRSRHSGVGNHDRITKQFLPILFKKGGETAAAHFLFPFNNESDVAGKFSAGSEVSLDCFKMGKVLAFVVAGPSPEE